MIPRHLPAPEQHAVSPPPPRQIRLRAVARASDGHSPATTLGFALLRAVDVPDASGLIPAIYSRRFDRPQIAALAGLVFADAGGDAVAAAILDDAAGRLVKLTATVACQLRFDALPIPLCFTGGVLLNQAAHRERVLRGLAERSFQAGPITLVQDAVVGALLIAADDEADLKLQAQKRQMTNKSQAPDFKGSVEGVDMSRPSCPLDGFGRQGSELTLWQFVTLL